MPRYSYYCESCETISNVFHAMDVTMEDCPMCLEEGCLQKMVSKPSYRSKITKDEKPKDKVEKHIESAREELERQREDMKNEEILDK